MESEDVVSKTGKTPVLDGILSK
jgi:hypothetical protein